jgi:glycosyltransferase involved in cell wall biosynthesis
MRRAIPRLNVLIISRAYPPSIGGISTHVRYLADALSLLTDPTVKTSNRICRVHVVTATATGPRATAHGSNPIDPAGTRPFLIVHSLPGRKAHFASSGDVPFERPTKFLLDNWSRIAPHIIHVHDFESLMIGLMLKACFQKPLLLTVHRTPKDPDPTLAERDVKNCFMKLVRRFDFLDQIIAPSNAYRRHVIEEGFTPGCVSLIYHGVPANDLRLLPSRPGVLERFRINASDEVIFSPIRLDPHKSPETIIDAAPLVKSRLRDRRVLFVIAGSGSRSYRNELEERARRRGVYSIIRLGAADHKDVLPDEMPTLYRRAKLCLLPSKREGLGQVLLEAAAFKTPCVAANTGGIPEIITPNETGLFFNRDEPRDLADQVWRLLNDESLASRVAENAAERLGREFNAELMAQKHFELYRQASENGQK